MATASDVENDSSVKFDPLSVEGVKRLRGAMLKTEHQMDQYRSSRLEYISEYVGQFYSNHIDQFSSGARRGGSDGHAVPVNFIEQFITIYMQNLASSRPRALIESRSPSMKPTANSFEIALNHLLKEIDFENTLEQIVLDALFGFGICKIGLEPKDDIEVGGVLHDVGQPFADKVDIDDFTFDTTALKWEQVAFIGNRYRRPYDWVMESKKFENTEGLSPSEQTGVEESGIVKSEDLTRDMTRSEGKSAYRPFIDLWDIYFPMENRIITIPDTSGQERGDKPLRVVEWAGPENGPYRILSFRDVPNQLLPLAPLASVFDLHLLGNNLFRKLERQARRRKKFGVYQADGAQDQANINQASDGDTIRVDNLGKTGEMTTGGIDQPTLAMFAQVDTLFSRQGGNLDSLGGLAPSSETARQDQMISTSASQRLQNMQRSVRGFARFCMEDIGYWLWTDPLIEIPVVKRENVTGIEIEFVFTPEERENDFFEYNINIDPFSLVDETPSMKLAKLQQFLESSSQLLPFMQEQGMTLDVESILRDMSKFMNMPSVENYIVFTDGAQDQAGGDPINPNPPSISIKRTTQERISSGRTDTRQGANSALTQAALSGSLGEQAGVGQ